MANLQPDGSELERPLYTGEPGPQKPSLWSKRYGLRHQLARITQFPAGVRAPRRVRVYYRLDHFVLQWWDPGAKRNLSDRVDGDLVEAILKARQIEERLEQFRSSGPRLKRASHEELVKKFLADLHARADAGEIDPRTVARYSSALGYYRAFVERPEIARQFPHVSTVNREFALAFAAQLKTVQVQPNGHPSSQPRPMRRPDYVIDVVRAMYQWGADPDGGRMIPEGFRNPFTRRSRPGRIAPSLQLGDPDITLAMAADFLDACDAYQLGLFAPLIFYGLRAAEPCYFFREHLVDGWLRVPCLPELAYLTKGRREKHLPVVSCVNALLAPMVAAQPAGLLYLRRGVLHGSEAPALRGASLDELVRRFQQRCLAEGASTAIHRRRVRDVVLHDAGGITYDHIVAEFQVLAHRLGWSPKATLKDFRHLFATCLENAGMPEHYRKFLMGHSPGRAAIITYTHLNEIRQHYEDAVQRQLRPLEDVVTRRARDLTISEKS